MKIYLFLITAVLGVALLRVLPTFAEMSSPPAIELKQGEATYLKIPLPGNEGTRKGKFLGKTIYFNRLQDENVFGAIIGVDLDEKISEEQLTDFSSNENLVRIQVRPNKFERQEVKVPSRFVNPSPRQLKRVNREKNELHEIFSVVTEKKVWNGNFIIPVQGVQEGRFGSRRVFNGEARNPHSGEDIAAPEKTPVVASNDGIVVGVVNHFFSGRGVIIDHGQGLFTEYFHLYQAKVRKGQKVNKGTQIGWVGHTGRATGPHLHWGLLINGARVNPFSLLNLKLETS
ncbi:MAG: M23 family metallopeptidase [Nitrospirae bacterium]|nr:M23 family metallopeptidase [Nitrospirota bacterium]